MSPTDLARSYRWHGSLVETCRWHVSDAPPGRLYINLARSPWAAFLDRFGINAKPAQHIKMNRGEGFTAPELSRFFIDCRVLGADRLMHVNKG